MRMPIGHTDLQLEADPSARFLPWVISIMMFLATLAACGSLGLNRLLSEWQATATTAITVEIPFVKGSGMANRIDSAVAELMATPGITKVTPLTKGEIAALLEPWLGASVGDLDLPLPGLIDVRVDPAGALDLEALAVRLNALSPGAKVDGSGSARGRLVTLARAAKWLSLGIVAVICTATVLIIVFATKAGLTAHNKAIEVLHLIGARDGYIARQFQQHCLLLALKGAVPGCMLAVLAVLALGLLSARLDAPMLAPLSLTARDWALVALLPIGASALTMLTARLTVLQELKRTL